MPPNPDFTWGWRLQSDISGGGLFADIVSHRIDLMVYFLGEPVVVNGMAVKFDPASGVEEAAMLAVKFKSGALCNISGDFASSRRSDRFVIAGTKGCICTDRIDSHNFFISVGGNIEELAFSPDPAPHLGLIRHIERVLSGQKPNCSPGDEGMLTDSLLDTLREENPGKEPRRLLRNQ